MMLKKIYLFLFLSLGSALCAAYPAHSPRATIPEETWAKVLPHLLPEDHEIKEKLDQLFEKTRVTLSSRTMEEAGFGKSKPREFSHIVVAKNDAFPGYVFKIYLDKERKKSNEKATSFLLRRVNGALAIQKVIDENDLSAFFKVPKKWIYLLPPPAKGSKKYAYKDFILVEEDMYILDKDENKRAWKTQVTESALSGLYMILHETGLVDGAKIGNIPFSIDGKITFIDTESCGYSGVPYMRLKKRLSHSMKRFWSGLVH